VKLINIMAIEIHNIVTNSGYLSSFYDKLNFLTEEEIKEFNCIGYSGKNSKGEESNFSKYLNSLNKGEFQVEKTKHDNGDFSEKFTIVRVTK